MLSVRTDFGCSDVAMQHCSRAVNLGICLHTTTAEDKDDRDGSNDLASGHSRTEL